MAGSVSRDKIPSFLAPSATGERAVISQEAGGVWTIKGTLRVQPRTGPAKLIPLIFTRPLKEGKEASRQEALEEFLQGVMAIEEMIAGKTTALGHREWGMTEAEVENMFRPGATFKAVATKEEGKTHWCLYMHLPIQRGGQFPEPDLSGRAAPNAEKTYFVMQRRKEHVVAVHPEKLDYERGGSEYESLKFDPNSIADHLKTESGKDFTTGEGSTLLSGKYNPMRLMVKSLPESIRSSMAPKLGIHTHSSLAKYLAANTEWITG
jgi:hypothetical protein